MEGRSLLRTIAELSRRVWSSDKVLQIRIVAIVTPVLMSVRAELEPFRVHLRHTAVSLFAESTNQKHVAVMAGHTSVSVVLDRYGHLYPQGGEELIRRLDRRAGVV